MTENSVNNFLANHASGNTILKFEAEWCGACKQMQPALDSATRNVDAKVVKIDNDSSVGATVSEHFGVRGLPTLIFLKNGKEVARLAGAQNPPAIRRAMQSF